MASPISASGRTCWIGIRVSEFDKCEWYQTDEKHIEDYFNDVPDDEYTFFIYKARPGDCVYSRTVTTPQEVIDDFSNEDASAWTMDKYGFDILKWKQNFSLSCSCQEEFPGTFPPTGKEMGACLYESLEKLEGKFVFSLQEKKDFIKSHV